MSAVSFKETVRLFKDRGIPNPRYDATVLFEALAGIPSYKLIAQDVISESEALTLAIERRLRREPLQYILGEVEFFSETYTVTPDCLIPRQDTEVLVEYAVANIPTGEYFVDLCTGSGAVAISTLANTVNTKALATDISLGALNVAKINADRNNIGGRVTFLHHDVLSDPPPDALMKDPPYAILSNPPYVTNDAYKLLEDEIFFEPRSAFVAEEGGMEFYRRITEIYSPLIKPTGFIAYEIGYDQADVITEISNRFSMNATVIRDLSGNPRVAVLRHKN